MIKDTQSRKSFPGQLDPGGLEITPLSIDVAIARSKCKYPGLASVRHSFKLMCEKYLLDVYWKQN